MFHVTYAMNMNTLFYNLNLTLILYSITIERIGCPLTMNPNKYRYTLYIIIAGHCLHAGQIHVKRYHHQFSDDRSSI